MQTDSQYMLAKGIFTHFVGEETRIRKWNELSLPENSGQNVTQIQF